MFATAFLMSMEQDEQKKETPLLLWGWAELCLVQPDLPFVQEELLLIISSCIEPSCVQHLPSSTKHQYSLPATKMCLEFVLACILFVYIALEKRSRANSHL